MLATVATGLGFTLRGREELGAQIVLARGAPYEAISPGRSQNRFAIDLSNQSFAAMSVRLILERGTLAEGTTLAMQENPLSLAPGASRRAEFFVSFLDRNLLGGKGVRRIGLSFEAPGAIPREIWKEVPLVGPLR